jgi:hypothetical protein
MGTYSLLIGPSQPLLEQEGEKKLEKEEEKNNLENDEEGEREEQSPKNMPVQRDEKTTGTVTVKIGDRDIKKEEEKNKVKDMETKLLCAEPEAGCGETRRNESAGESEPEVEEAEGGRSEVRPTCQQQGDIPPEGGGVPAVEILPPEHGTPAAVELGKSAITETAEGPLSVVEIRLAAPTLRQAAE